jgi:hypothetical protein
MFYLAIWIFWDDFRGPDFEAILYFFPIFVAVNCFTLSWYICYVWIFNIGTHLTYVCLVSLCLNYMYICYAWIFNIGTHLTYVRLVSLCLNYMYLVHKLFSLILCFHFLTPINYRIFLPRIVVVNISQYFIIVINIVTC